MEPYKKWAEFLVTFYLWAVYCYYVFSDIMY